MPRDIPIGNGRVLVAFDNVYQLREFYFPHVGEENHTQGHPFRIGVFVDGKFSWIPEGWQIKQDYSDDSLVTQVELFHEEFGIRIRAQDAVDFHEDIYLKKMTIENLFNKQRVVKVFLAQDFCIYGNSIGDTAEYRPENKSILHYKGDRYFLVNLFANEKYGVEEFATGDVRPGLEGSWKDAEDGDLSRNPIAQGSVDSVVSVTLDVAGNQSTSFYYWIACGKNWEEVKVLNDQVQKKGPNVFFDRTYHYWKLWVNKEPLNQALLPPKVYFEYKRSLLVARTQMNNCGSIIAANDSEVMHFNRDTYSYMWPRDGALVAYGLNLAGYSTVDFFNFCAKVIEKGGYFLHKYNPSGSLASSWHPWIYENHSQLPIQEDETALVIWALWNHYEQFKDIEFIKPLYKSLIKRGADFMMNYRDPNTGLPLPSYDLWEERQGVLTFTVSAVYGGLIAASKFTEAFGEKDLSEDYKAGALRMKEAMDKYLYLKDKKRFARSVTFDLDGTYRVDDTIDASVYGIFAFGVYDAKDPKVASTMSQVISTLWHHTSGGLARYEHDSFYRNSSDGIGNPWFITTLWLAQYYVAIASDKKELLKALEILQWVADHALKSGVLSEQINPDTGEPLSVSPLTWSHGSYIIAVQEYLNKLLSIEKCPSCGLQQKSKFLSH